MKKIMTILFLALLAFQFNLDAKQKHHSKSKYKYEVAACLMFQNESFFLKEWIEYHNLIGVEHFYLFNNNSSDNYLEILHPYILRGLVELHDIPTVSHNQQEHSKVQYEVYNTAFKLASGKSKWLAIIDADEFLYPVQTDSLPEILKKYEDFGGLYVTYLAFGTANVEKIPSDRLIIETLNMCAPEPINFGKSIVRPERISNCNDPHRMWYKSPYYHVNTDFQTFNWQPEQASADVLLLYHYSQGDINHAVTVKYPRRNKWYDTSANAEEYLKSWEWLNSKINNTMQRFIPALRKKIQEAL